MCEKRASISWVLFHFALVQYADGDKVEIKVHKLSSPKTQLPYDYYSLPFCKPEEVSRQAENLGEVRLALRPSAAVR